MSMKYCCTKASRVTYRICFLMFLWTPLVMLKYMIEASFRNEVFNACYYGFCAIFLAGFCAFWGYITIILVERKYSLCPEGIVVEYSKHRPRQIPWDKVSEVAICHIHRSKNRNGIIAIRVAIGDVFVSSDDPYGLWQESRFSLEFYKNVVIIAHSAETEEEFRRICPIPIINRLS